MYKRLIRVEERSSWKMNEKMYYLAKIPKGFYDLDHNKVYTNSLAVSKKSSETSEKFLSTPLDTPFEILVLGCLIWKKVLVSISGIEPESIDRILDSNILATHVNYS